VKNVFSSSETIRLVLENLSVSIKLHNQTDKLERSLFKLRMAHNVSMILSILQMKSLRMPFTLVSKIPWYVMESILQHVLLMAKFVTEL
jgi:hypothetical protein